MQAMDEQVLKKRCEIDSGVSEYVAALTREVEEKRATAQSLTAGQGGFAWNFLLPLYGDYV